MLTSKFFRHRAETIINAKALFSIRKDKIKMNKENDKKFDGIHCPTPSSEPVMGEPEDSFDMVNKYGTYNIQPTSQTGNSFPHIAQGLPKKRKSAKKYHKGSN